MNNQQNQKKLLALHPNNDLVQTKIPYWLDVAQEALRILSKECSSSDGTSSKKVPIKTILENCGKKVPASIVNFDVEEEEFVDYE